jgi:hypothetical protein
MTAQEMMLPLVWRSSLHRAATPVPSPPTGPRPSRPSTPQGHCGSKYRQIPEGLSRSRCQVRQERVSSSGRRENWPVLPQCPARLCKACRRQTSPIASGRHESRKASFSGNSRFLPLHDGKTACGRADKELGPSSDLPPREDSRPACSFGSDHGTPVVTVVSFQRRISWSKGVKGKG